MSAPVCQLRKEGTTLRTKIRGLTISTLRGKVLPMESNWAAEHLQVIRTLMERSALYRRALAPIMIYSGVLGCAGGGLGWALHLDSPRGFVGFWSGVGVLALVGSFLLVRRQALKATEPFWSPPTRRVAQGLLPPFFAGGAAGLLALVCPERGFLAVGALPGFWVLLYGCALCAAGFFMRRGIKLLGWLFVLCGCTLMGVGCQATAGSSLVEGHVVMGGVFGGAHLACGIYLYFTEPRGNET